MSFPPYKCFRTFAVWKHYAKDCIILSIELGTEILKQGTNLKLSGAERITDMIIEKKQEEVKNDSTICKK